MFLVFVWLVSLSHETSDRQSMAHATPIFIRRTDTVATFCSHSLSAFDARLTHDNTLAVSWRSPLDLDLTYNFLAFCLKKLVKNLHTKSNALAGQVLHFLLRPKPAKPKQTSDFNPVVICQWQSMVKWSFYMRAVSPLTAKLLRRTQQSQTQKLSCLAGYVRRAYTLYPVAINWIWAIFLCP